MGTGASKSRPGVSAAEYVAEEANNASEEALTNAFTGLSDSERQRVLEALHTANMLKATTSGTVCPASCGVELAVRWAWLKVASGCGVEKKFNSKRHIVDLGLRKRCHVSHVSA